MKKIRVTAILLAIATVLFVVFWLIPAIQQPVPSVKFLRLMPKEVRDSIQKTFNPTKQ